MVLVPPSVSDFDPLVVAPDFLETFFAVLFAGLVVACFLDTSFFDAAFLEVDLEADFLLAFVDLPAAFSAGEALVARVFFALPLFASLLAFDFFVAFFAATFSFTLPWSSILLSLVCPASTPRRCAYCGLTCRPQHLPPLGSAWPQVP